MDDIRRVGVVATYARLKLMFPDKVSLNALWALYGAVHDTPWDLIPEDIKQRLKDDIAGL